MAAPMARPKARFFVATPTATPMPIPTANQAALNVRALSDGSLLMEETWALLTPASTGNTRAALKTDERFAGAFERTVDSGHPEQWSGARLYPNRHHPTSA